MVKRLRRLLRLCDHRFIETPQGAIILPDCVILYDECVHCGKRRAKA